jgi:hypothetical protein
LKPFLSEKEVRALETVWVGYSTIPEKDLRDDYEDDNLRAVAPHLLGPNIGITVPAKKPSQLLEFYFDKFSDVAKRSRYDFFVWSNLIC